MKRIRVTSISGCIIVSQWLESILLDKKEEIFLKETFDYGKLIKSKIKDIDIIMICMKVLYFIGFDKLHETILNNPAVKVIVFNVHPEDKNIMNLIRYGVKGIIYDNDSPHAVFKAIKKVYAGELWIKRDVLSQYIEMLHSSGVVTTYDENNITRREREILSMLVKGYTNNEIAEKLEIKLTTVKTHLYHAYRKMNIKNREEAIRCFKRML